MSRRHGGQLVPSKQQPPAEVHKAVTHATTHLYFQLYLKIITTVFCVLLAIWGVISAFKDVKLEKQKKIDEQKSEQEKCRSKYNANFCQSNDRPELVSKCEEWRQCMEREPTEVPTLKIAVRYSATLINDFVNMLSPKSIGLIGLVIAVWMWWPFGEH